MRTNSWTFCAIVVLAVGFISAARPAPPSPPANPQTDVLLAPRPIDGGPSADATSAPGTRTAESAIAYRPPLRSAPSRRIVAGTRGAAWSGRLAVLAPDHLAWSGDAQPTLYWFNSSTIAAVVEITIVDDISVDPILEVRLQPPLEEGVHGLDLESREVQLARGQRYRWSVSIVHDPGQRSRDTFAEGAIEHVDPPLPLRERLAALQPEGRAREYAAAGYWYDALDAITELIERRDGRSARWRAERLALLDQVGIELPDTD